MEKMNKIITQMQNDSDMKKYVFFKLKEKSDNKWLIPLKKAGFFNPTENPKLEKNKSGYDYYPRWEIFGYLEKVASQNIEKDDKEIWDLLIEIINGIISYEDCEKYRTENINTYDNLIILIGIFPIEYLEEIHIQFICELIKKINRSYFLENELEKNIIPKLVKAKRKTDLIQLFDCILETEFNSKDKNINNYFFKEVLKAFNREFILLVDEKGLDKIIEKIKCTLNEKKYIYIPSIESHEQNRHLGNEYLLIKLARIFIDELSKEKIIKELLNNKEYPIFCRLGLYGVNKKYDAVKELFWEWFDNNSFKPHEVKRELYLIFEKRGEKFTPEQVEKVLEWVENLDFSYIPNEDSYKEKIVAYRKKEWLISLKENSKKVKDRYDKYHKINSAEVEHPGWDSYMTTKWGSDSPFENENKEELMKKSCKEIVNLINEKLTSLSDDDLHGFDDKNRGIAQELITYVTTNAMEVSENMSAFEFEKTNIYFKTKIIYGLDQAWNKKTKFNWENVLDFLLKESKAVGPIEDEHDYSLDSIKQYKSSMADLIESGVKDDNNAFEKRLISTARVIIFNLLEDRGIKDKGNIVVEDEEKEDLIMLILNSYHGKVLESLVNLSLREARVSEQYEWNSQTKDFFTEELEENNHYSKYIFSILGMYFSQFMYLDKEWVLENFEKIFPIKNEKLWKYSISCYFKTMTIVDYTTYDKFKEGQHLEKVFQNKPYKKAIDMVVLAYMNDHDKNFINKTLDRQEKKFYERLSWFVEINYEEDINENNEFKLKEILVHLKRTSETNLKYFSSWISCFNVIDDDLLEIFKIAFGAKDSEYRFRDKETLESFIKLSESNAEKISELYLHMVTNNILLTYPKDKVIELLEILKRKSKAKAVKIINIYAENGYFEFKNILKDLV